MSRFIPVPASLWCEVRDFFAALVAPCKDCVWGNPAQCWRGRCAAFRFRDFARRIKSVSMSAPNPGVPRHRAIEDEIMEALRRCGGPVHPSEIILSTTCSKVNKSHAISRLIRQGRIIEVRTGPRSRKISLPNPPKEN